MNPLEKSDMLTRIWKLVLSEQEINSFIKNYAFRLNSTPMEVLDNHLEDILIELLEMEVKFKHDAEDIGLKKK